MKSHSFAIFFFFLFCWGLSATILHAQDMKIVQGRVLNKGDKNKPFKDEIVEIYSFYTVDDAADALHLINMHQADNLFLADKQEADPMGNYEIRVPDNGALIFKVSVADAVMERVNGRLEINVGIDAAIQMDNVDIVGVAQTITLSPLPPEIIGDKMFARNIFPVAPQYGKENARLIIQPYVVDCTDDDTVSFLRPMIFDGEQYYTTQDRRMNFDLEHDPLARFVDRKQKLSSEKMSVEWVDTVKVPNPQHNYHVNAVMHFEDYRKVYYEQDFLISTCNARRPLKFLEYSTGSFDLPAEDFHLKPKREKVPGSEDVSLTFLVGKAELDPDNPDNELFMNQMRQKLLDIVHGEGTTLREFNVTVTSSPEGAYQSNLALANRRVVFAQQQATSILPAHIRSRVYMPHRGEVASWTEVADSLERDSLVEYAERVRAIVAKHPNNMDAQFQQIRALPFYTSHIKDILPHLRRVRFEWVHEVYRELTPQEIYDRYLHDEDYRTGKKSFALYEYWHLFNMEKEPKKLQKLYMDAYKLAMEMEDAWAVYPANKLAISYLDADTVDLNLLEPFIDRTKPLNYEKRNLNNRVVAVYNRPQVFANQVAMFLKVNKFTDASVLVQLLPKTDEYKELWAFTLCLGGYYKSNKEVFNIVKASTPVNEVVMYLARDTKVHDQLAAEAVAKLSDDNPLKWYFKGIISSRAQDLYMCTYNLAQCFKLDTKYIQIAQQDGDLDEDAVTDAVDQYEFL